VDRLANHVPTIDGSFWWDVMSPLIMEDFFRDSFGSLNFRFP